MPSNSPGAKGLARKTGPAAGAHAQTNSGGGHTSHRKHRRGGRK